eukprot:4332923-Pleurochrysis_carterae.AAC.1
MPSGHFDTVNGNTEPQIACSLPFSPFYYAIVEWFARTYTVSKHIYELCKKQCQTCSCDAEAPNKSRTPKKKNCCTLVL